MRFFFVSCVLALLIVSTSPVLGQWASVPTSAYARPAPLPAELKMFPDASEKAWQPVAGTSPFLMPEKRLMADTGSPSATALGAQPVPVFRSAPQSTVCYRLKTYSFTQDADHPDATTFAGVSPAPARRRRCVVFRRK